MEVSLSSAQLRSQFITGIALALMYDLFTAAKGVYVGHLTQGINPMLLTFVCFVLTALFFNSFQLHLYRDGKIIRHWKDVLLSNIVSVGTWIGYFYALKYLEPAVTGSIVMGSGPAIMTLLPKKQNSTVGKLITGEKLAAFGVLASITFLILSALSGNSAVKTTSRTEQWLGLIAAAAAGISAVGNTIASKRLNLRGFNPNEVMATRFYLLMIVTGAFVLIEHPAMDGVYSQFSGIVLSVGMGLIVPLACCQMAIARLEPMSASFIFALLPIFMLPIQVLDHRLQFSLFSATGVIFAVGFVCLGTLIRFRSMP